LGFVPDVAPYFESCRVFVAPLRFGAGMKGKVGQSMSHGLPIVATKIGAEGMGLRHETEILIADGSQDFANSVNRLYSDEILWRKLSHNGLAHVEANYSLVTSRKRMADIFSPTQSESVFPANEWPKGGHPANSTYPALSVEQSVTREVAR
jgi:glycosyltransferase involved in cell wall biosynthesis